LLTCKDFLRELSDYLDDTLDPQQKAELQRHVNECPNCWVVCDTTQRTLKVFKGLEAKPIPAEVHSKLMQALDRKMKEHGCGPCGDKKVDV
jgi:anti-sigma factor (TIGR02949 family)